jgi:hypothetical protein
MPLDVSRVDLMISIESGDATRKSVVCLLVLQNGIGNAGAIKLSYESGRKPLTHGSIRSWQKNFLKMGSIYNQGRTGRPCTSKENVQRLSECVMQGDHTELR